MVTPYEVFWLLALPVTLFSWYHIIRHSWRFIPARRELPPGPHPRIVFQFAARKQTNLLQEPVNAINRSCKEAGFTNYVVRLVVDGIEDKVEGAETILVPKEFTCMSRYKARALHYAIRFLPNNKDVWTLHLDEDALVTSQGVVSMVRYIQDGGNPVANGPTVFPYDNNLLTFFAEAQRQWTFYWLMDQEMSSAVHWLNGSNLLIRSDIEQQVGWDFIHCYISEDARFGYEATKEKVGDIFGWHGGLTIEKAPVSFTSLIKQRMRWFFGSLLNFRYVPKRRTPRRLYSIVSWVNGLILTSFFFFLVTGILDEPWLKNQWISYVFLATAVFWIGRYWIGIYQNLRYSPLSRFKKTLFYLAIIPLAPFIDFICGIPTILAVIIRPKEFQITSKGK